MNLSKEAQGDLSIIGSGFFWGIFPVITILSYHEIPPLIALAIGCFFAAIFFAITLTLKKCWHEVVRFSAYKNILLASVLIGVFYYLLNFIALKYTTAGNMSIVDLAQIFFSFFLFHVIRKDHIPKQHIIGATFMVIGALTVLLPNFNHFNLGDLLVLIAAIISPIGNFFAQRARKQVSSETIMFIRSVISAVTISLIIFTLRITIIPSAIFTSLPFLLINGFLILGLSKIFWLEGIHRISITKANAIASIAPFFALLFGWILLQQTPTTWQLSALIPIVIGMYFLGKGRATKTETI